MVSGKKIYGKIEDKISEVRMDYESITNSVCHIEKQIDGLMSEREDTFTKLATHYLPALDVQGIQDTLHEVQDEVRRILKRKEEKRGNLMELMQAADDE